jgi:DNA-binding MarR family transcriptional regulator
VTTTPEPRPLVAQCMEVLRNLACQTQPQAGVWSELDLTMSQLKAVIALNGEGSMSVGHLAHVLAISEPAASVLVDRLEGAELALRECDPHDRRKIRVVPTAKARELSERLLRVKEELMAQWLERLSEDDLRALLRGTEALLDAAVSLSCDALPPAK